MPRTARPAAPQAFAPAPLGPLTLRNRIIKAATFEGVMPGGTVSDELVDFHRRVAAGGAAMSTVAYLAVSPEGRTDRHCLLLDQETVPGLRRLTDAVHAEGAAVAAQIGHAGPVANARSNRAPRSRPRADSPPWARACARWTSPESSASPRTTAAPPRSRWRRASTPSRCTSATTTSSAPSSARSSTGATTSSGVRWRTAPASPAPCCAPCATPSARTPPSRPSSTWPMAWRGDCGSTRASRSPGSSKRTARSMRWSSPGAARSPTPCTSSGATRR